MDNELADMHIHSTNGVVQEVYVSLAIKSPSKADSGLLTAAEVNTLLADHSLVPVDQDA